MRLTKRRPGKLPFTQRLYTRFVARYFARDLLLPLQMAARDEAVAYIRQHLRDAQIFKSRFDLLKYGIRQAADGLVLEFGVYDGASIRALAGWHKGTVHGFDSFEGLPETWTGTSGGRGHFDRGGKLPNVPQNVTLHPGWFDHTLPTFLQKESGKIAFLNIDCDIYSSTKQVLQAVAPRLVPGSLISFDEYFNYPNWRQHEFRAFQEAVTAAGLGYRYLGFTRFGGTVLLRIEAVGSTTPGPL